MIADEHADSKGLFSVAMKLAHKPAKTSSNNEILGHAWVEYYISGLGWIASDPTWGNGYFSNIDFLRFSLNNGAWFFLP